MTDRTYIIQLSDDQLRRIHRALIILDAIDPPGYNSSAEFLQECCKMTFDLPEKEYDPEMLHGFTI